ncbi:MAG TPA: hypothetical protein VM925_15015 [Labilithrix sp.]|nr:hypothetical protein [Labilithrix sp.]
MLVTSIAVAEPARAASPEQSSDELTLRDGRHVHGRVVEKEPGRWIVLETEDGNRHTFAWEVVAEVVQGPAAQQQAKSAKEIREAWRVRGGDRVSYELRAELAGVLQPGRTFDVTGVCATGTGVLAASIYGQTATDRGRAAGGGLGGRLAFMFLSRLEPGSRSWWALRAGTGLDLQLLYARIPTGIAPASGQMCSQVARSSHEVEVRDVPLLLVQVPFDLGAHVGLGGFVDALEWRGIVLGAAWAPSFIHIGPWTAGGSTQLSPLGFELTFDFTTLHATAKRRPPEQHLRMSVSVTLPSSDGQATLGTLAFGPVWY